MTSQKNHSLHEKKTMNYDFRLHTLFHKDFSMVLFEDKIIEKPYGVFIYTSYGCSTSCCLWNIMWFSLCETWRQREFALKKFHSHEIFAEENIGINVWFVCHYSLPKACYWKIQNLLSTLRYTLAISFQVWFSLVCWEIDDDKNSWQSNSLDIWKISDLFQNNLGWKLDSHVKLTWKTTNLIFALTFHNNSNSLIWKCFLDNLQ